MPSAAPWAATELARLPVEAQAERREAELARARGGHRDHAVLEGVRGVGRVVLDPHLAHAQARGEAIGADRAACSRRAARAGARLRPLQGQEVVIAPDVLRAALDAPARVLDVLTSCS
jgi:hypothetical protein